MTDKEMQDDIWARLSPDLRTEIKTMYDEVVGLDCGLYRTGTLHAFENIFGHHNLTSDTEPEEMLCCSRKVVQKKYSYCMFRINLAVVNRDVIAENSIVGLLEGLFGKDKCLPDTSEEKPTPKFKCGDIVKVKNGNYGGSIMKIINRHLEDYGWIYDLGEKSKGIVLWFSESDLAPYTEPKFKVGDKVMVVEHKSVSEIDIIGNENKIGQYHVKYYGWFKPEDIIPYTEPKPQQTEENMEEKELNLAELLKGCEGEKFYSPYFGTVSIINVRPEENRLCIDTQSSFGRVQLFENGSMVGSGECVLFPSRALYEKYPLEASKAWQEWTEERKPKIWRAEKGKDYWYFSLCGEPEITSEEGCIEDDCHYDMGNYFRTETEAKEAAEAVKRTLENFHLHILQNENK